MLHMGKKGLAKEEHDGYDSRHENFSDYFASTERGLRLQGTGPHPTTRVITTQPEGAANEATHTEYRTPTVNPNSKSSWGFARTEQTRTWRPRHVRSGNVVVMGGTGRTCCRIERV